MRAIIRTVQNTADLQRIKSLPRRRLSRTKAEALAKEMTGGLALRKGEALRRWQAQVLHEAKRGRFGAFGGLPVGQGKAQPNDEPVLTPDGWVRIADLRPGDEVVGANGSSVRVMGVYPQGLRKIARVTFTDGSWARSDYDHLWTFRTASSDSQVQTRTLREWKAFGLRRPCGEHAAHKLFALQCDPVILPWAELPIDPYTLGALLGDGCFRGGTPGFTSMDLDIVRALRLPDGVACKPKSHQNSGLATDYILTGGVKKRVNPLTTILRMLGLWGCSSHTKFVPAQYWGAAAAQREALLQGLLDTDGATAQPGGLIEYSTASDALADAIEWLTEGLGGSCRRGVRSRNGNHRMGLKIPRTVSPFRCSRKRAPYDKQTPQRGAYRAVESIEPAGRAECTCIAVDAPDRLYVTRHCLLTHNTLVFETMPVHLELAPAVLVINASLEQKTYSDRRALAGKWRLASPPPRIITREALALESNAYLLDTIKPRLIMIDEVDDFANFDASATQRIHRYVMKERKAGRRVKVVAATGTPTRRSILGVWHILIWCLGDGAPVPLNRGEAEMWAAALDDAAPRQGFRASPGALGATLEDARKWYLDRVEQTPGVILVDEDSAEGVPLRIALVKAPECKRISKQYKRLYEKWESPSGEAVSDPLSLRRIDGQIGTGLFSYWDPPPPQYWREARTNVAAFIRKRIAATRHARKPLDTDAQVMRAHPTNEFVEEWLAVRKDYNPLKHGRVEWFSDATLDWAGEWLTAPGVPPSVLWCGGVEFATRLSKILKVPYYGPLGRDTRTGRGLHNADPRKHMVVSWHANKRGFNLQAWRRNAIVQPPQSSKFLEQVFGRPHRAGQTEAVRFEILATSGGTIDAWHAALGEAEFAKRTMRITQKILRAEIAPLPTLPDTVRWATKTSDE